MTTIKFMDDETRKRLHCKRTIWDRVETASARISLLIIALLAVASIIGWISSLF